MEYITLLRHAEVSMTERKSVFIGNAAPVKTEEEAMEFISQIKKKYGDATHNTYAYLLANGSARYSDDGEPQGTAGVPILSVIQKAGFYDAVIVVTRYFGGILLGAGGLVRAYSASARDAVNAAQIVSYKQFTEFKLICSYSDYQKLIPLQAPFDIREDSSEFTDNVVLNWAIEETKFDGLSQKITELCGARVAIEKTGSRFSA